MQPRPADGNDAGKGLKHGDPLRREVPGHPPDARRKRLVGGDGDRHRGDRISLERAEVHRRDGSGQSDRLLGRRQRFIDASRAQGGLSRQAAADQQRLPIRRLGQQRFGLSDQFEHALGVGGLHVGHGLAIEPPGFVQAIAARAGALGELDEGGLGPLTVAAKVGGERLQGDDGFHHMRIGQVAAAEPGRRQALVRLGPSAEGQVPDRLRSVAVGRRRPERDRLAGAVGMAGKGRDAGETRHQADER